MSELGEALRKLDSVRLIEILDAVKSRPLDDVEPTTNSLVETQPRLNEFFQYFLEKDGAYNSQNYEVARAFAAGALAVLVTLTEYARTEELQDFYGQSKD